MNNVSDTVYKGISSYKITWLIVGQTYKFVLFHACPALSHVIVYEDTYMIKTCIICSEVHSLPTIS